MRTDKPIQRPRQQPPNRPSLPVNDSVSKPYELVSLPDVAPQRAEVAGQQRFRSDRISGKISLRLTVKTTAFIASGVVAMGSDISNQTRNIPLIKTSVLRNQGLLIPGSSLKGVVRSIYEAITASCLCKTTVDRTKIPDGYGECRNKNNLCPACQVFGAMGWQGLVRFPDAVTAERKSSVGFIPSLYAPRPKRAAYYLRNGKVAGRKFYYHTIKAFDKGSQKGIPVQQAGSEFIFTTQLHFMNLTLAELGTLLIVLGQDKNNAIALKVGGGKPIGMGTMVVENIQELELLQNQQDWKKRYCNYEQELETLTGNQLQEFLKQAIAAAHQTLVRSQQMQQIREVLQFPTDREPPEGMY